MPRDLLFTRFYPHPPERVWHALTDSRALARWLMENDFVPEVGREFRFRTRAAPGFDGMVHGQVLEVDPPRRLVYTWQGGPLRQPTRVTWTLAAAPGGTDLRLEHTGFRGAAGFIVSTILGSGWRSLLQRELARVLAEP